ncbi:MAG: response regulator [Planctomycetes bacterium]|nr:response regulator [Planctomycetota bacterium]MBZ0152409.1 response regulator [Planctomycetota bacterium]MCC7395721.1 response regulator [Planctomycetota bacterium]
MNYRILIVDDSPLLRATARRAVLQAGASAENVREAQNGKEALDALSKEPADIVLLDINMPVMDGYQFVEEKARRPELAATRVALVTTEGNKKRLARMTELGVEHYLRKPFEPEDLRALVGVMFEGK